MKKRLKSFLKYTLFSGFLSVTAVASPIASPGTSTIYNGVNSGVLYSPTVNNNTTSCDTIHYLVNEHVQGWYSKTVDLSPFTQCSNATLVIKAAGGKGGIHGGLGGITILRIPLQTIINYYGSKVTFDYVVGGAGHGPNPGGNGGQGTGYEFSGYGGGGGGESLVSLINWPWYGGVPLAIGGGGGGGGSGSAGSLVTYIGGDGGGGNDPGSSGEGDCPWYISSSWGSSGSCWRSSGGGWGGGGSGWYCLYSNGGGSGGDGWYGSGGSGAWGSGWSDGIFGWSNGAGAGGGGGYGGGGGGGSIFDYYEGISAPNGYGCFDSGSGGGGYCNTSLGSCQASDWTNGGGNPGDGYVEIYVESNE